MSPDAFRRFCLLALCTAYVVALGALALYVSAILAAVAAVFGGLLALTMTIEPTPESPTPAPAGEPEGLSHRAIDRMTRRDA